MCFEFDHWATVDGGALNDGSIDSAEYGSKRGDGGMSVSHVAEGDSVTGQGVYWPRGTRK